MSGRRDAEGGAGAGADEEALAKILELLGRRPHFRAELARKLAERGYDAPTSDRALARAAALGYLGSDEELAVRFAEELARRKGLGRSRIARELRSRGAPEAAIGPALEALEAEEPEAELERARAVAARWTRRGSGAAALARHLSGKGFATSVIFRVSKEFASDADELPADDE